QQRQAAYEHAKEAIRSRRYTATMLQLGRWLEAGGWRDQPVSRQAALLFSPVGGLATRLVAHRWRPVRKRSKRFETMSLVERHRLRIALKKLRYTVEFLESLLDGRKVKMLGKRLKPVQEELGRLNDVRTAHSLVDEITKAPDNDGREIGR